MKNELVEVGVDCRCACSSAATMEHDGQRLCRSFLTMFYQRLESIRAALQVFTLIHGSLNLPFLLDLLRPWSHSKMLH